MGQGVRACNGNLAVIAQGCMEGKWSHVLGWRGLPLPLGATVGPALGCARGQGGEVHTVGPGHDPHPRPPRLQGAGGQLSRGGGEGAQCGCRLEVRGGCPGLAGGCGGLGQGGEAISLVFVRQEDARWKMSGVDSLSCRLNVEGPSIL